MSPVTHFLTGWVFANCTKLKPKDRAIVTLASVGPDLDGLGLIAELLTRNTSHPLLWFSLYHHSLHTLTLHTLTFALVVAALSFALAFQKWKTGLLALLSFHLHLVEDVLGARGPDGYQWPIPYLKPVFVNAATYVARTMAVERVAQYHDHSWVARDYLEAGVAARILASGDVLQEAGSGFC
jgi:hypothetical protein